jgi:hypothetical protein
MRKNKLGGFHLPCRSGIQMKCGIGRAFSIGSLLFATSALAAGPEVWLRCENSKKFAETIVLDIEGKRAYYYGSEEKVLTPYSDVEVAENEVRWTNQEDPDQSNHCTSTTASNYSINRRSLTFTRITVMRTVCRDSRHNETKRYPLNAQCQIIPAQPVAPKRF